MEKATIIGIDLAKRVFQVHGATQDGRPVFRKKVSRAQLLGFLAKQPAAVVAMEACATAHGWGRAISGLGHEVRLIPPIYVKPFVRRQKNDAADAEAIADGWPECWPTSRAWWWPLPWPTRWLVRPGRCLARAKNIEDQRWRRPDRQALTLVRRR